MSSNCGGCGGLLEESHHACLCGKPMHPWCGQPMYDEAGAEIEGFGAGRICDDCSIKKANRPAQRYITTLGDGDQADPASSGDESAASRSTSTSAASKSTTSKRSAGRPAAAVRSYFTNIGERNPSTKRYDVSCNLCKCTIRSARQEAMSAHLQSCERASTEIKDEIRAQLAGAAPDATAPTVSRKGLKRPRPAGGQSLVTDSYMSDKPFATTIARSMDLKLLRWLITSGVPFNAVDSNFFLDWVNAISVGRYTPKGQYFMCRHDQYFVVDVTLTACASSPFIATHRVIYAAHCLPPEGVRKHRSGAEAQVVPGS
jgi:hypothetical protein